VESAVVDVQNFAEVKGRESRDIAAQKADFEPPLYNGFLVSGVRRGIGRGIRQFPDFKSSLSQLVTDAFR
jgi:hypothetical protein